MNTRVLVEKKVRVCVIDCRVCKLLVSVVTLTRMILNGTDSFIFNHIQILFKQILQ